MKRFSKIDEFKKILVIFVKEHYKILFFPSSIIGLMATLGIETPEIFGLKNFYLWISVIALPILIFAVKIFIHKPFSELGKLTEGNTLKLKEIEKLRLTPRVVILGLSNVGKTTLINSFFNERFPERRTQSIEGRIKIHKGHAICLIDISGEKIPHAFQVLKMANFIILMIDHSGSDRFKRIELSRKDETRNFIKRIKDNIEGNFKPEDIKKVSILFLVNKKDLWQNSTKNQVDSFKEFYNELFNLLGSSHKNFECIEYSNRSDYNNNMISPANILDKICEGLKNEIS